jgi:superkiller protein 3
LGRWGEAAVELRRSVELYPGSAVVWQQLGDVLRELGKIGEAESAYRQSLELKPGKSSDSDLSTSSSQMRGVTPTFLTREKTRKVEEAIEVKSVREVYEKVGGFEQINLEPKTQADIKDQKLSGREEKVAYYRELAERNPDSTEILLLLGDALEESGFYEQALAAYNQAIKLEPDSIQAQNKFASALSKTDLYFCFCSEHHYILLGQIWHKRGQMAKALAAYRNAIKINPNCHLSYHYMGDTMFALTDYPEAVVNFHKSIDLNPDFPYSYINLGHTLFKLGSYDEAVVNFQRGIELAPDSLWAYYSLGDALACLGKIDEASLYYYEAVKLDPNPH